MRYLVLNKKRDLQSITYDQSGYIKLNEKEIRPTWNPSEAVKSAAVYETTNRRIRINENEVSTLKGFRLKKELEADIELHSIRIAKIKC